MVIPELVAYHSIMRIRNIQLRKYHEAKKAKEKAERGGIQAGEIKTEDGAEKGLLNMTEEEIFAKRMEMEAKGGMLSELE